LVGSGFAVILQFLVFLLLGIGLWSWYGGAAFERSDEIFARFILESLPVGITGLLVAGVLAAAMSSLSSSISALASATAYDFWAPLAGRAHTSRDDDERIGRVGRVFTLLWSGLLIAGALVFLRLGEGAASVEVALGIASLVYGALLGAFLLAARSRVTDGRAVAIGMLTAIALVTWLWLAHRSAVAWPWYVPIGAGVTLAVGLAGARSPRAA